MIESPNRIEINCSSLAHNFHACRQKAGGAPVMAMVKADGYGHGMVECARIFSRIGACAFGVEEVAEGVRLRQADLQEPILILSGVLPEYFSALIEFSLTPVVVDTLFLEDLSRQAVKTGKIIGVQLKADAGMGRQGCMITEIPTIVERIGSLDGLRLDGIMAHFPKSDDRQSINTAQVLKKFQEGLNSLKVSLRESCCFHIANSGGLLYGNDACLDMVRPGLSLYGCYPDGERGKELASLELQPAMRFVSRVVQLRHIPAGIGLGYGHIYTTHRPSTIAVLPVGYADGYLRCLSNKAQVLVQGKRVPVVGRISMNLTLVDMTDVEDVRVGEEVVLLGQQQNEEITADEIADWMGTISYEVLCLFGNLNHRIYAEADCSSLL